MSAEVQELHGVAPDVHQQVMAEAERIRGWGEAAERWARDPVNQPTISSWVEAMGNDNPRWRQGEAPPSGLKRRNAPPRSRVRGSRVTVMKRT